MTRPDFAAMIAQHVITRSTTPIPQQMRWAAYYYAREMNRQAQDAKNAEGVRNVR